MKESKMIVELIMGIQDVLFYVLSDDHDAHHHCSDLAGALRSNSNSQNTRAFFLEHLARRLKNKKSVKSFDFSDVDRFLEKIANNTHRTPPTNESR